MLDVLRQVTAAGRAAGPHSPLYCYAHKAKPREAVNLLEPRASEEDIASVARWYAGRAQSVVSGAGRRAGAPTTSEEMRDSLNALALSCGARPVADEIGLSGRIARMVEPSWWRRTLHHELLQKNEAQEHAAGVVRKKGQCYVTNHAVKRTITRARAARAMMEAMEVVNGDGEAVSLALVADASVSNPKLRRSELMVRCRGFEETAKYMGHEAVFLTITAPSRFHRFDLNGRSNKKWTGETPKDGQAYLNGVWKKIRAEWGRQGFYPYGFRVAEPHHDGCPHWHILLFAPPGQIGWFEPRRLIADRGDHGAGLVGVAGTYALQDTPGERGAALHRFKCEPVEEGKGGATAYISKYICKNVDGKKEDGTEMGLDFASGTGAVKAARRVRTWSSVWGIRQFQQIGGPSVTVWRELRRLGKGLDQPLQLELFEGPRAAADRALWSLFWVLQGGPDARRKDLTLKPMYVEQHGGRYDEVLSRVKGVQGWDAEAEQAQELVTRLHEWKVQRAGLAEVDAHWARFHGDDQDFYKAYERVSDFEGREATPWTGVNNCTAQVDDDEAAALKDDFLRGGVDLPTGEMSYASSREHGTSRASPPSG